MSMNVYVKFDELMGFVDFFAQVVIGKNGDGTTYVKLVYNYDEVVSSDVFDGTVRFLKMDSTIVANMFLKIGVPFRFY